MSSTSTESVYRQTMTSNYRTGKAATTLRDLVVNYKENFLRKESEIMPGLLHNQYEIVKRTYFYIHQQFESGPYDDQGQPKYFYDMITHRNDQSTKNIEVDTKNVNIQAVGQGAYLKSWFLRREFMAYAKTTGFGKKLNEMADDLPDFGTVVWKKIKLEDGSTDVTQVELINLINDPIASSLKDGLVIERHLVTQDVMRSKKVWDQTVVTDLINSGYTSARKKFLTTGAESTGQFANNVDEYTPYYELYEVWGEIPRSMYEKYKTSSKKDEEVSGESEKGEYVQTTAGVYAGNESVFVMAIVGGCESGGKESVLFCRETDRDLFPYKEVHYRRRKGRWMGVGNYEMCFPYIEKANELTNRFFASLRIALMHLYQTRDQMHVKNILTDLLDGDIIVTKSEITAIPTEIRGHSQYVEEINRIERNVDAITNSLEVVTGSNLPSGTPFALGQQQLAQSNKLFNYVRQNEGLFLEEVFNEWLLPSFARSLTKEHILDLIDDSDDLEIYYNARRKLFQYEAMKDYILETGEMPDATQLSLVGSLVKDQIVKGPKQALIEANYYKNLKYSIKVVITDENDQRKQNLETLSNTFSTVAANPAALQDPRLMRIMNMILEQSGYSPYEINAVNQAPTNPSLNPANQGGGGADNAAAGRGAGSASMSPAEMMANQGQPAMMK